MQVSLLNDRCPFCGGPVQTVSYTLDIVNVEYRSRMSHIPTTRRQRMVNTRVCVNGITMNCKRLASLPATLASLSRTE